MFSMFSPKLKMIVCICLFFMADTLCTGYVHAGETAGPTSVGNKGQWHITSDEILYDEKNSHYILKGNIYIAKDGLRLTADSVQFDQENMNVLASGHVVLTSGEDILTGDKIELDLEAETGTLHDGTIFFKENNFYIKGDKILKTGKQSYEAQNVSVSTCEGERPAWKITGRNLKITIEGYGFITHAALWAQNIPALYTPFFAFPAKIKRQSGLLTPRITYSDRKGTGYEQPFFWAIDKSSDATFYMDHMQKRGEKYGVEYRYAVSDRSKGTFMFDYLNDRKVDDNPLDSDKKWGYIEDASNDILRPDSDRFWYRMKLDQELPKDFFAKLDLDIVSDQDYLREFKDGLSGFDKTDEYFEDNFRRELDEYDVTHRVNKLNVSKSWTHYNLNAMAQWKDNIVAWEDTNNGNPIGSEVDTTVHYLPSIEFDGLRQEIPKTPLTFKLESQYTYLYREDATTVDASKKCHRTDLYPRVFLPLKAKNYLSFEPSVGLRETVWYVDEEQGAIHNGEKRSNRQIYDAKLDLSTEIFKDIHLNEHGVDRIRHVVWPRLIYEYIPEKDQEGLPNFDSVDRIERKNLATFSITNTFTSRSKIMDGIITSKQDEKAVYTKHMFCRFKIEQSYDIYEEKEDDKTGLRNGVTKEPFYPLYLEFEVYPVSYLTLRGDAKWTFYEEEFLNQTIQLNFKDATGNSMALEYRYKRDPLKSIDKSENILLPDDQYDSSENITLAFNINALDPFSIHGEYERDLFEQKDVMFGIGFLYKASCWSLDVYYKDEDDEQKYAFMVNLHGLGGLGTGI